nr:AAA family ATPase [uncultured Azospirillum sp.]
MSVVTPLRTQRRIEPFEIVYPSQWAGQKAPPRDWVIDGAALRGTVCLFSGDSGLGKSLLMQQLLTCAALGLPWLGMTVDPCKTYGMFCEDPIDELQRRQEDINRYLGVDAGDLELRMAMTSRVGKDNALMRFNRRSDQGETTPLYDQLRTHVLDQGAQIVVVDTAAQVFDGVEINRGQVTMFVNALARIAMEINGTVILTSHPSTQGMQSGTGTSGSTAWKATVRCHMYLKRPKGWDEEDEEQADDRVLKTMKSNYGKAGAGVKLRWVEGVFTPMDTPQPTRNVIDRIDADNRLVDALRYLVKQGNRVAMDPNSRTGFANLARGLPSCKDLKWQFIADAQGRLIDAGKIVAVEMGPPSRRFVYLRTPDTKYPGERAGETGE